MEPSAASSDAVPVKVAITAAGEAPRASTANPAPPVPRQHWLAEISDRGADVSVGEFAARAYIEVPPDVGDGGFALGAGRHMPLLQSESCRACHR